MPPRKNTKRDKTHTDKHTHTHTHTHTFSFISFYPSVYPGGSNVRLSLSTCLDATHTATERISDLLLTLLAIAKDSFAHSEKYPEEEDSLIMSQGCSTQVECYSQVDSNGKYPVNQIISPF